MTLEELKKLSPDQLTDMWWSAKFPFDRATTCGECLTNHKNPMASCKVESHQALKAALPPWPSIMADNVAEHLDELYALRLFFKDLYPSTPEVEEPQPVEETVEAT